LSLLAIVEDLRSRFGLRIRSRDGVLINRLLRFLRQAKRTKEHEMADQSADRGLPFKPARPLTDQAEPPLPGDLSRPGAEAARAPAPPRQETEPWSHPRNNEVDVRTLIVGPEMSLSGDITSCNRLIVEGTVDARLDNCQHVIITETGVFTGDASTDNADVHGCFEGDLVVRKRLLLRATGRVSGTITYGEIEIECGGKISGTIQAHDGGRAISQVGRARVG
jgi:cytoskeletal protein CcmA (bactofilin family)